MKTMTYGESLPKRLEYFDQLCLGKESNPNKVSEYFVRYQNNPKYYPTFYVPITLPKYRLANGRTKARQEEYIAKNADIPEDFFSRDLESESALAIQHELLKELIVKPSDKGKDLLTYFKKNNQDEPILLDSKGFVINGNRRLCAFRELYYSDPITYKRFENILAVILPSGTEKQIDELEARLQIAPDIKEEYSWIAKACMIRSRQKDHNYTEDELSDIYDMKTSDIHEILSKLQCAERYLKQYGHDKLYSEIEKDDYAFNQIRSGSKSIKPSTPNASFLQNTLENLSFKAIQYADKLNLGRNYAVIGQIYSLSDNIIKTLQNELLVDSTSDNLTTNPDDDLFGFSSTDSQNTLLLNALQDKKNDETALDVIKNVILSDKEDRATNDLKSSALRHLKKAHSELSEASSCLDKGSDTAGLDAQLCELEKYIEEIRRKCNHD